MHHVSVTDELVQALLERSEWEKVGLKKFLTEDKTEAPEKEAVDESDEDEAEVVEEDVKELCPLCKSTLTEALSEDQLAEHVEEILSLLEAFEKEDSEESNEDDEE